MNPHNYAKCATLLPLILAINTPIVYAENDPPLEPVAIVEEAPAATPCYATPSLGMQAEKVGSLKKKVMKSLEDMMHTFEQATAHEGDSHEARSTLKVEMAKIRASFERMEATLYEGRAMKVKQTAATESAVRHLAKKAHGSYAITAAPHGNLRTACALPSMHRSSPTDAAGKDAAMRMPSMGPPPIGTQRRLIKAPRDRGGIGA